MALATLWCRLKDRSVQVFTGEDGDRNGANGASFGASAEHPYARSKRAAREGASSNRTKRELGAERDSANEARDAAKAELARLRCTGIIDLLSEDELQQLKPNIESAHEEGMRALV